MKNTFYFMDKGLRTEITKRKHIQRLRRLNLTEGAHYCYKHQTRPCSCFLCKRPRYSRKSKHKEVVLD